jgi:uncharacterized delta-60 repeat protein
LQKELPIGLLIYFGERRFSMLSKCRFLAFVKQMFLFGLLVFLTAALNTTPCQASAGDLDPTFGDGGLVVTDIEGKAAAGLTQILLKTDGKIIGTSGGWYLLRFNADGTLDDTFGDEGVKSTFGKFLELEQDGAPQVVALQPDGRILVGGYKRTLIGVICNGGCHEKFTRDFHLARFNGDGTLDTTFGTNGRVTTDFSHLFGPLYAELAQISMISIQEDGKIVAVGSSETRVSEYDPNVWNVALVRYNTDGTLDTTFGTGGIAIPDLGIEQPRSEDMVLQSDGKIVVAGNAKDDYGSNL